MCITLRIPFSTVNLPAATVAPPARKLEWWNIPFFFWIQFPPPKKIKIKNQLLAWQLRQENLGTYCNSTCPTSQGKSRGLFLSWFIIYLSSIQSSGSAHNKNPLCSFRSFSCIKKISSLFVHNFSLYWHIFIMLPLLLEKVNLEISLEHSIKCSNESNWKQFYQSPISMWCVD